MSELGYEKDSENIVTIVLSAPVQAVSSLDERLDHSLGDVVARLENEEVSGVILLVEQNDFGCGSKKLLPVDCDRQKIFDRISSFKNKLRRLEALGKPVVAAIKGGAVGSAYELCLAANHRIAVNDPDAEIGLPHVSCGVLPGSGGTARLVRLLGLEKSLPLLMEGSRLSPEKALAAGLVDQVATDQGDLVAKAKAWVKANPQTQQPWDQKNYRMPGGTPTSPNVAQMVFAAPAILRKKSPKPQPAPEAILSAAVEGALVDVDSALRIESRYLVELLFNAA